MHNLFLFRIWRSDDRALWKILIINPTRCTNLTFRWRCIVINSYDKTNQMHQFLKFIFGIKHYMFRTVHLSIIRSFSLYTQQWCMSYRFANSSRTSCQQTFMTHNIAACTVKNSWWWTEELSETRSVLFQKTIWKISASNWFYHKNLSRCTVTRTSNLCIKLVFLYSTFYFTFYIFNFLLLLELSTLM